MAGVDKRVTGLLQGKRRFGMFALCLTDGKQIYRRG